MIVREFLKRKLSLRGKELNFAPVAVTIISCIVMRKIDEKWILCEY